MYTILVPLDDHEPTAHKQAAFLDDLPCGPDSVDVVLTHVIEGDGGGGPTQQAGQTDVVQLVREELAAQGYDTTFVEAASPPAAAIVNLVDEVGADQVVVGGGKRSPAGKALFGSVAQYVALNSPVPVTIVRADEA